MGKSAQDLVKNISSAIHHYCYLRTGPKGS